MRLLLDNLHATVAQAAPDERRLLHEKLAFSIEGARYSDAFRAGRWDGKRHLYDRQRERFPAGLLARARREAALRSFPFEVEDRRVRVEPVPANTSWLDLARGQPQVLDTCLAAGRGVVHAPTGAGKTECFIALAMRVPCRWLVLVHKKDLLRQTAERFELRAGERAGQIGDGSWREERFTVATVQTLSAALRDRDARARALLLSCGGVVADECHTVGSAEAAYRVLMSTPSAYWRFGFSATPLIRGDERGLLLIGATGPVIHRVDVQELVDAGKLSRPTIRFVPLHQSVPGQDWHDVYRVGVVESAERNALVVRLAAGAEKPCLVFAKEIDHGRALLDRLQREGLRAEFVQGRDVVEARRGATKRLERGDLDVLVATTIFDEGIDIPELRSVVNAGGGKSAIKAIQHLGRGMRIAAGKSEVELWDVLDRGNRWLAQHASSRRAAYEAEGHRVEIAVLEDRGEKIAS